MFTTQSHRTLVRTDHEQVIKNVAMSEYAHSRALEEATSPLIRLSHNITGAVLHNLNVVPCLDVLAKRTATEYVVTVDVIPHETLKKWRADEHRKKLIAVEDIQGETIDTTAIPYNTSVLDNDILISALLAFIQTSVPPKQRGTKGAVYSASTRHLSFAPTLRRKVWNQMLILDKALCSNSAQLRFEGLDARFCHTFALEVYVAFMVNRGMQ